MYGLQKKSPNFGWAEWDAWNLKLLFFAHRFCIYWALHGFAQRDGQLPRLRGFGRHQAGGQPARETVPAHSRHGRRQRALPAEHDAHSGAHRRGCPFPTPGMKEHKNSIFVVKSWFFNIFRLIQTRTTASLEWRATCTRPWNHSSTIASDH